MPPRDVLAAGAVVYRAGKQVLLVHRPKYDDWSFPKGKVDPGEHVTVAAVREVEEETGLHVRLGPPLAPQRYPVSGGRAKHVSYWVGRVLGSDDVSGYRANDEIDAVRWLPFDEACDLLSYDYDRTTLHESRRLRRRTQAVVVLRHGSARSRRGWGGDDRRRPLVQAGSLQAERLVPVLAAYGVSRVLSSGSKRCVDTVAPFADTTGWPLEREDGLSEEDATDASVQRIVEELAGGDRPAVVCTHRPVLPAVLEALGIPDEKLEPGAFLVAHLRRGKVVGTERHWLH